METGTRPLVRASDMFVFDGIPMDVIKMVFKIFFVFQRVLPKSRLPDSASSLPLATLGDDVILSAYLQPSPDCEAEQNGGQHTGSKDTGDAVTVDTSSETKAAEADCASFDQEVRQIPR